MIQLLCVELQTFQEWVGGELFERVLTVSSDP